MRRRKEQGSAATMREIERETEHKEGSGRQKGDRGGLCARPPPSPPKSSLPLPPQPPPLAHTLPAGAFCSFLPHVTPTTHHTHPFCPPRYPSFATLCISFSAPCSCPQIFWGPLSLLDCVVSWLCARAHCAAHTTTPPVVLIFLFLLKQLSFFPLTKSCYRSLQKVTSVPLDLSERNE